MASNFCKSIVKTQEKLLKSLTFFAFFLLIFIDNLCKYQNEH